MSLVPATKPLPIKEAAARWRESVKSILAQAHDNDIRLSGLVVDKYLAFGTAFVGDGPYERHKGYYYIPSTELDDASDLPDDISSITVCELIAEDGELAYPLRLVENDLWTDTSIVFSIDKIFIMPDEVARLDQHHAHFFDAVEEGDDQEKQSKNQPKKTRIEFLASLEKVKKELEKVGKDKAVIVARLMDEYEAKAHHIVELFKIESPANSKSKDPQKGKERKVYRLRVSGRKTLIGDQK